MPDFPSFTPHLFAPGEYALDSRGHAVPGYSLDGSSVYSRSRIHAAPWRLKEWDFYQISDERLCLQLVIGHISYVGNCNIALFNHETGEKYFERGVGNTPAVSQYAYARKRAQRFACDVPPRRRGSRV